MTQETHVTLGSDFYLVGRTAVFKLPENLITFRGTLDTAGNQTRQTAKRLDVIGAQGPQQSTYGVRLNACVPIGNN